MASILSTIRVSIKPIMPSKEKSLGALIGKPIEGILIEVI
jgi:hypothetical protein